MSQDASARYKKGWGGGEEKHPVTRVARVQAQNYQAIKEECLKAGKLFEDPDFPAVDKSVLYSQARNWVWKRPPEISKDARMIIGGASRFDVKQGELGNCWFLASVASLCTSGTEDLKDTALLEQVVCPDNSFIKDYAGVVHFNVWQYGKWVDVVIDDRLPTQNGRLVFMHSADPNEFWSALLEKAYAKLCGSYEALTGGCTSEAMEDFTGGLCEMFNVRKEVPKNFFQILEKGFQRGSLMGCTIDPDNQAIESVLGSGLIVGHAYSITGVRKLQVNDKTHQLVRIRNPWGNQYEWKGAWGDSSPEWNKVSPKLRKEMGLNFEADGEFWMAFDDLVTNYHKIEICNLSPEKMMETPANRRWEASFLEGSWKKKVNAGGCRNFLDTFWTNPQYRVEVIDPDEGDDEDVGTIIVALMQKERRKKRSEGLDLLTIGFSIYHLPDPACGVLELNFFKYNKTCGRSAFSNMREVGQRFRLPPGHYVIIPTTFKPNEEADYLLRIYSERPNNTEEIDEETGFAEDDEEDEKALKQLEKDAKNLKGDAAAAAEEQLDAKKRKLRTREVTEVDAQQEREVRDIFKKTAGEDLELDAYELRTILDSQFMKEFKFSGFSLETCRSMVAMKDTDKSGKLGYDEFKALWTGLRTWTKIFKEFDKDKSGNFNSYELREALASAGIKVSNSTFNGLVMRYSDQEGLIFFDDYILCAVRLKTMFDVFRELSREKKGVAQFTLDEFIQTTMYS